MNKAEAYVELLKVQMDHFKQTRDIELKVNLALWSGIVIAGAGLRGTYFLDTSARVGGYVGFALLLTLAHMFFWMRPIQLSEDRDHALMRVYRAEVRSAVGGATDTGTEVLQSNPEIHDRPRVQWVWVFFESAVTAVLLLGLGLLLAQ